MNWFDDDPYQQEIDCLIKHLVNVRSAGTVPTLILKDGELTPVTVWKDENLKKLYDEVSELLGRLIAERKIMRYDQKRPFSPGKRTHKME